MNLIWHTALSVFDLGSSLLYSLLGRDLTEAEIALIELLFRYMRKTKYVTRRSTIRKRLNLMETGRMENEMRQLQAELTLARLQLQHLLDEFLPRCQELHCKDVLLISCRHNGYNLLQLSIESLMATSFRWLDSAYKFYLNDESQSIEAEYNAAIEQRMRFVNLLLEKYACDPNRGKLYDFFLHCFYLFILYQNRSDKKKTVYLFYCIFILGIRKNKFLNVKIK